MNAQTESASTCPLCGEPLSDNASACTKCDWFPGYREQGHLTYEIDRRDLAAGVLSVVPGAGHLLKGHDVGWLLMLGVPFVLVLAFAFTMFFGWLLVPAYWISVAVDAFLRKDLRLHHPAHPTGTGLNNFLDIR
jgi:hypothetical protein